MLHYTFPPRPCRLLSLRLGSPSHPLLLLRPRLLIRQQARQSICNTTPRFAYLPQFPNPREYIFAGRSARISFPIHAASHDDNDPRADRYNDETDRNRLELSLSVSILTLHIDRRDRLIKYGDKSISVDSDGVNPMHDRQARL